MIVARTIIRDAVFGLFDNNPILLAAGFKSFSTRVILWGELDAAFKPSLMMTTYGESHERAAAFGQEKVTLKYALMIYTYDKFMTADMQGLMNPLLDAIDQVLAPDPMSGRKTIGDIVQNIWVEGEADITPGDLDGDGLAVYPINVLVP